MASVRKLKPNDPKSPWICEYTDPSGKRRRYTPKTGLKKDADAARRRIEGELERGEHVANTETVTVAAAVRAWLADCQRRWRVGDGMAGSTFHKYMKDAEVHVIPKIGHIRLNDPTLRSAAQNLVDEKSRSLKWNTLKGVTLVVTLATKFAAGEDLLKVNPFLAKPLRLPRRRKEEKAIPSKEEIHAILSAVLVREKGCAILTHHNRIVLVVLALLSGLRSGEICGLQWENVDLDAGCLNIKHSLSKFDGLKGPKTDAGIRKVDLSPPVLAMLKELKAIAGQHATGHVLTGTRGKPIPPRDIWCQWHPVLKKAGLVTPDGKNKYTFHALRHAAASLLIEQGLPAFHISRILGHGSIKITMDLYGHMFPEDESGRRAIAAAAGQFAALGNAPRLELPSSRPSRSIGVTHVRP